MHSCATMFRLFGRCWFSCTRPPCKTAAPLAGLLSFHLAGCRISRRHLRGGCGCLRRFGSWCAATSMASSRTPSSTRCHGPRCQLLCPYPMIFCFLDPNESYDKICRREVWVKQSMSECQDMTLQSRAPDMTCGGLDAGVSRGGGSMQHPLLPALQGDGACLPVAAAQIADWVRRSKLHHCALRTWLVFPVPSGGQEAECAAASLACRQGQGGLIECRAVRL